MDEKLQPPGVTALYVHDGRVIAHVSDFHPSAPGGFTLLEAQTSRAKRNLAIELVRALSSPHLAEALDEFDCAGIMRKMKGTVLVLQHGHSAGGSRDG